MNQLRFNVEIKEIEKVNSLFARCKIYICYADLNRNNSIIPRNVINENLHTLFNCPIVGEYSKSKEDFLDHGGKLEIDKSGEIEYVTTTIPYGVVPESSEIKWENINGKDYLTCTGYLWVDRYPEVLESLEKSDHPQSMEIANVTAEYNDKKQLVVSKFNFSGLCILGVDVEPCFPEASIQLYTLDKEEFKNQFNLMIDELRQSLSQQDLGPSNNTEEGIDQDINLDFTNINNKEDEVVSKSKKEIASQFALTVNQLYDEISRSLSAMTYKAKDWWTGEEVDKSRYYMCDFDDTYVYAVDKMQNYIDVKLSYSMSGDNVVIDFENVKRIKYVPTDWDEGSEDIDTTEVFVQKFISEIESEITAKVSEFAQTIAEKDEAILSVGQKIQDYESKFTAQETLITEKDTRINELSSEIQNFKKQEEDEQVESLLKEFSAWITEDEKEDFRNKREQFAKIEDFKKEIRSFVTDRVIEKSKETDSNKKYINMALIDDQEPEDKKSESVWDRLKNIQ